jgi:hypothetical protein
MPVGPQGLEIQFKWDKIAGTSPTLPDRGSSEC